MPRLALKPLLFAFAAALVAMAGSEARAQLDAHWSAPVSGEWTQTNRWSTAPLIPTSTGDRATLDAQGSPYVVTAKHFAIDRVEVASPDATLRIEGGIVSAANGIHVAAGKLDLVSGVIENTRISGGGAVAATGSTNSSAILRNVTLATNATVAFPATSTQRFRIDDSLQLENAALHISDTPLQLQSLGAGELGGQGTIRLSNSDSPFAKSNYVAGSWVIEPGIDLTFAGGAHQFYAFNQTTGRLVNRSNIAIEAGSNVAIFSSSSSSYGSFRNEGTITVGEGASLGMRVHTLVGETGGVGNLLLAPQSKVWLGAGYIFYVDKPINVPATARLELAGGWVNQSQINVASGATLRLLDSWGSSNWGGINVSGATVELGYTVPFSRLAQLDTSSNTKFVSYNYGGKIALEGKTVNLGTVPGNWNLEQLNISGGTLTGLANGGVINLAGGFSLTDVRLAAANNVVAGRMTIAGASTIAAPLAVSGGTLTLQDAWKNESILSATGGRLALLNWSTAPGTIAMTGGSLQIGFNQSFPQLLALPVGTPDELEISTVVDLQGATVDLGTLPWDLQLGVAGGLGGLLRNGVISAANGKALRVESGSLENIELLTDLHSTGSASLQGNFIARNVTLSGNGLRVSSTAALFDGVSIDGIVTVDVAGLQIANGLTLNGEMHLSTRRLQMTGDQTIDGAGKFTTAGIRSTPGGGIIVQNGTLTLDDVTFLGQRRGSLIELTDGGLVNRGTIAAARDDYAASYSDLKGPGITIRAASFTQQGELSVVTGEELRVEVDDWTNDGVIRLAGGKLTTAGAAFRNGSGGEITGAGTIDAAATDLVNLGVVAPGTAVGALTLNGDYAQQALGQLQIELGGTTAGVTHDLLAVSGAAALDGSLKVSLVNGFVPTAGDVFSFLTSDALTGLFSAIDLPTLPEHLIWETLYGAEDVALRVVLPGDFDNNGAVDGDDFLAWQSGQSPRPFDSADLDLWRQNYGIVVAAPPATATVPEPASILSMASMAAALVACRRYRVRPHRRPA